MEDMYYFVKNRLFEINKNNKGVATVEVILILVDIYILNSICVLSIL